MLIGIVGAPNSGKSTFFRALTLAEAETAEYPFTTIKPNQGVAFVSRECPCRRLGVECSPQNSRCADGRRLIPVRVLDVAGLVPGAHEGKGLGNQFLDDLRHGDALIHVLDASGRTDSEGKPAQGFDPSLTAGMLEGEIDQWIFGILGKNLEKLKRTAAAEKLPMERLVARQLSGLGITEEQVARALGKASLESLDFASLLRKESKPMIVAANKMDVPGAGENLKNLGHWKLVACSAESELALKEAERAGLISYFPGDPGFEVKAAVSVKQEEALSLIKERVLSPYGSTGVQKALEETVFGLLGMVAVYPVASISRLSDSRGNVLPDAHIVKKGTTLRELAEKIHKDLASGFIGGLDLRKQKVGADYELKDGDVLEILFRM